MPQAGRPFVVTDPGPPITYSDVYTAIEALTITPFRLVILQPVVLVLLSHAVEWYTDLLIKWPVLRRILPPVTGDVKHLQPGIFSICTHLLATNKVIGQPVSSGGLGYTGVVTTMEAMAQEIAEWNQVHQAAAEKEEVSYQTSIKLASDIEKAIELD